MLLEWSGNHILEITFATGMAGKVKATGATGKSILKITEATGMVGEVNFENHFCSRDVWNVNLKITCAIGTVENIDVFLLAVRIFFGESSVGWENKCNWDGPGGRPTKKPAKLEQGS